MFSLMIFMSLLATFVNATGSKKVIAGIVDFHLDIHFRDKTVFPIVKLNISGNM
jgi:hypothetical protein